MVNTIDICESCGKAVEAISIARNLGEQFINDARREMWICVDCFNKRFTVNTKKRTGSEGIIYELEEKPSPRLGLGSSQFSCLECEWVAWSEEGLRSHVNKKHPR